MGILASLKEDISKLVKEDIITLAGQGILAALCTSLAQDLVYVLGPFQRGFGGFSG